MAGAGHGAPNITHGGLSLHATRGWHSRVGQGMCAVMWFWVLYRAKQDGAVLMGWRHPWEGHGHDTHNDHGNGHEEVGGCRPVNKDDDAQSCRPLKHFTESLQQKFRELAKNVQYNKQH